MSLLANQSPPYLDAVISKIEPFRSLVHGKINKIANRKPHQNEMNKLTHAMQCARERGVVEPIFQWVPRLKTVGNHNDVIPFVQRPSSLAK